MPDMANLLLFFHLIIHMCTLNGDWVGQSKVGLQNNANCGTFGSQCRHYHTDDTVQIWAWENVMDCVFASEIMLWGQSYECYILGMLAVLFL